MRTETKEREAVAPEKPAPVLHIYPPGTNMGPGAVAYCGWIKRTPWKGAIYTGEVSPDRCVVCLELVGGR
jgi:hypothetical protein